MPFVSPLFNISARVRGSRHIAHPEDLANQLNTVREVLCLGITVEWRKRAQQRVMLIPEDEGSAEPVSNAIAHISWPSCISLSSATILPESDALNDSYQLHSRRGRVSGRQLDWALQTDALPVVATVSSGDVPLSVASPDDFHNAKFMLPNLGEGGDSVRRRQHRTTSHRITMHVARAQTEICSAHPHMREVLSDRWVP
ncbi:hypothetical protein C8Q74DRAFT_1442446 [Fomes fomentarius]|nr:hypothetical protein C8Q74DRAFT_1442446 [Fomes fomentarius]